MSIPRRKRAAVLVLALVLMALFVVRPGVNGLRKRLVNSVGLALGRRVDVQWVKLRLLPQPGFDLVNFIVHDDPSVSAEPMLRAQEVTAVLRLRSLLRGRIEIGRLSLQEPSLNLVRAEDGHWNIDSLIDRAAHTEAAPTRNTMPERRPVFPYIEAEHGRINFKIGMEKKSYALSDADFALWLESENQWGMRLAAQPVRTDFNLTDTGMLRLNGTWQRSGSLRETPVKFTFRWDRAQLGELTKLIYGMDMGWRGGLAISADVTGTPADLTTTVKTSIDDFRRYDIITDRSLRLATACDAHYSSVEQAISDLVCRSSIGDGLLSVKGRIGAPTGSRNYDLAFSAENIPVQALVNLARRAKKNLPDDLAADGVVTGVFSLKSSPQGGPGLDWGGSGKVENFALRSANLKADLELGTVPLALQATADKRSEVNASANPRLVIGPLALLLGKDSSATLQGWAAATGYSFALNGEGPVQRLLEAGQLAGLQVPQLKADGSAKFNLLFAGAWSGFAPPRPTGTAQLRSVSAHLPAGSGVIHIRSANLTLESDRVRVQSIAASAAGANWEGSLSFPRPCHLLDGCPVHFELRADTLAGYRFQQWLSPGNRKGLWYRFVGSGSRMPSLFSVVNATGSLTANRVEVRGLSAKNVSCAVELNEGSLHLRSLSGEIFGGKHRGNWTGDLRVNPPKFSGSGKFEHVSLAQLAETMQDGWITGTASANYQFAAEGATVKDWLSSAEASLDFEMRDGSLPHVVLAAEPGPLHVKRFRGRLELRNGRFDLQEGKLENASALYEVTGATLPGQKLQMKLAHAGGGSYLIDGTLSAPHIAPIKTTETRAELKP